MTDNRTHEGRTGELRIVEAFSGIGSQTTALQNLGIPHTSVCCEIDAQAHRAYEAMHGPTPNLGDITKVERLPPCDLLTYSYPCTSVSVAGTRAGMEEGSGTASSLVWEVGRLLTTAKEHGELPEYLLMENVKGVLHHPNKEVFDRWCRHLADLGYTQSYAVLNAKDFGVPQSRERLFMVSTLTHGALMFPQGGDTGVRLRDVMEHDVNDGYFLTDERIASYERHRRNQEEAGRGFGWSPAVPDGVAHTVVTSPSSSSTSTVVVSGESTWERGRDRADGHRIMVAGRLSLPGWFESAQRVYDPTGVAPTVPTGAGGGHIPRLDVSDSSVGAEQVKIRYLTPRECWRLQGFDDERIDRAFEVIEHDSARYRMAGNSIAVPCLEAIFRAMLLDRRFVRRRRLDEW